MGLLMKCLILSYVLSARLNAELSKVRSRFFMLISADFLVTDNLITCRINGSSNPTRNGEHFN